MIDYGNQIANILARYLPYTNLQSVGKSYQAQEISIDGNKVLMTFLEDDYQALKEVISGEINPNSSFTTSGFKLKNYINKFDPYPNYSTVLYGFETDFAYHHKLKKGDIIPLKGFDDSQYNISYKVLRTIDDFSAILYPISIVTFDSLEPEDLGYISTEYQTGFNNIHEFEDEDDNAFSFEIDQDLAFTVDDILDLDLEDMPKIHDFHDSVLVINAQTFLSNLTNSENKEYLIVDTSSLTGAPLRSESNKSDTNYSNFSQNGYFARNYSLNLLYLLERNIDDESNQTTSGSDIIKKQVEMFDELTKIIRRPLSVDDDRLISAMTIVEDSSSGTIAEGRVTISYKIEFSSIIIRDGVQQTDADFIYPIEQIKINTDQVNLS